MATSENVLNLRIALSKIERQLPQQILLSIQESVLRPMISKGVVKRNMFHVVFKNIPINHKTRWYWDRYKYVLRRVLWKRWNYRIAFFIIWVEHSADIIVVLFCICHSRRGLLTMACGDFLNLLPLLLVVVWLMLLGVLGTTLGYCYSNCFRLVVWGF